jgi:hypothetical protein
MTTGILQVPTQLSGTPGIYPNFKYMVSADNLSTVTTAGYLNNVNLEGTPITTNDVIQALYGYNPVTQVGTFETFSVSISSTGVITLTPASGSGGIILPTIANHIATYTNTTGQLSEDAAIAINGGNIQAGLSGTAGYLASYPATPLKGSMRFVAVANAGNTAVIVSNASFAQASTITIPDPAGATADFVLAPSALVNGNLVKASGTAGLVVDAGIAATSVPTFTSPTIANHIATYTNTSGNLSEDAATAINGGNIQAGLSGTAGTVASFPSTATTGSLVLAAVANSGNTTTTISNASMGQASVISIPDPAGATANFAVAPSALVSGNFVKASGTAGLVVDGGAAIHAGTTGTYAGGGTSNAFSVTGMTASWKVTASNLTSTNSVSITKVVPGSATLTITWSADPGANTTVSWVALTTSI